MRKCLPALFAAVALSAVTDRSLSDEPAAVGTTPTARTIDFLVARARRHHRKWEQQKAIADLREAVSLEPSNPRQHFRLGMIYVSHLGLADEAIASFMRAYELAQTDADRGATTDPKIPANRSPSDSGAVRQCRKKLAEAYHWRAVFRPNDDDIAAAQADLDRAVEIDPHSAEMRIMRAFFFEKHGRHVEALQDCDAAVDIKPKSVDLRLQRAWFLAKQGKYDEALRDCDVAAEFEPQSPLPWCSRAGVYQTKGDSPKAFETLNEAVARFPKNIYPYLVRAGIWDGLGEFGKALDDLNRAVEIDPENASCYSSRARILHKLKRGDEAVADDKKAKDLARSAAFDGPGDSADRFRFDELEMPDIEERAGESGELLGRKVMLATADVKLRAGPSPDTEVVIGSTGGLLTLEVTGVEGDCLQVVGKWVRRDDVTPLQTAAEFFSRQIEREPTPFAYASRAVASLHERKLDKALADAEEAARLGPEFALAYCTRADARMAQGNYEEALPDLDRALQLEPKLVVAFYDRALAHRALEDYRAALDDFDAAMALDPSWRASWAASRRSVAESLFENAQNPEHRTGPRQVIADLEKAVDAVPELRTARFYASRGGQHQLLNEYDKAVADLRKAIELEPAEPSHHSQLGMVYSFQQDFDQAITEYRVAYDLRKAEAADQAKRLSDIEDPEIRKLLTTRDPLSHEQMLLTMAYVGRANQRATQGNFEDALKDCDAAAELDQNAMLPLTTRAYVYLMKGNSAKAVDLLNQATLLFPEEAHPYFLRANVWKTLGQFRKALDDLNQAVELEPNNFRWYGQRAEVLRALKRDDEAAADEKRNRELLGRAGIK
ncbi:MAG TPA: tetratricopeptide repeat protein [Pirellulales bacterium]|nr:tetratricopeptide repeat protein [Pirellulales bacterium]